MPTPTEALQSLEQTSPPRIEIQPDPTENRWEVGYVTVEKTEGGYVVYDPKVFDRGSTPGQFFTIFEMEQSVRKPDGSTERQHIIFQ
jgi:hypothetical protein